MIHQLDIWTDLITQTCEEQASDIEVIRRRDDVLLARAPSKTSEYESVIIKCWNRNSLRGTIRRTTRTNPGSREYRSLKHMSTITDLSPIAIAYRDVSKLTKQYTEAIIMSDLGSCVNAGEHIKNLYINDTQMAIQIEDSVIQITKNMISKGMLDCDHRLVNFIIPTPGHATRIDFEHCLHVPFPMRHTSKLGVMIGTLLGSHVFATQPQVERSNEFATRLFEVCKLSPRIKAKAQLTIDSMMKHQAATTNVKSELHIC